MMPWPLRDKNFQTPVGNSFSWLYISRYTRPACSLNKHTLELNFDDKLAKLLRPERIPVGVSKAEAWQKIQSRISEQPAAASGTNQWWLRAAAVAAVIGAAAATTLFAGRHTLHNSGDTAQYHALPDGSEVWLAPGATISFNSVTWWLNRGVHATGTTYFEVAHGGTFTTYTPAGTVQVLGTSFEVTGNEHLLTVACRTGMVAVCPTGASADTLRPGEALRFAQGVTERKSVNAQQIDAWVRPDFQFENTTLRHAIETIAAYHDYSVLVPEYVQLQYSGSFPKGLSLSDALEVLCKPFALEYSIDPTQKLITITK